MSDLNNAKNNIMTQKTLSSFLLVFIPIIISGLTNLPAEVKIGATSLQAVLVVVYITLLTVCIIHQRYPVGLLKRTFPFAIFVVWAIYCSMWSTFSLNVLQNLFIFLLFLLLMLWSGAFTKYAYQKYMLWLNRAFTVAGSLAIGLVCINVSLYGFGYDTESKWFVDPRSFSMFGLIIICRHLALWRYGNSRSILWIFSCFVLIGLSMSRMAFAAAIILFFITFTLDLRRSLWHTARVISFFLIATVLFYGLVSLTPLAERMFAYQSSQSIFASEAQWFTDISLTGRGYYWEVIIESAAESPIYGKGTGSSKQAINAFYSIDHPHNDYLRVLHDQGIIGLTFFLFSIFGFSIFTFKRWRRLDRNESQGASQVFFSFLLMCMFSMMMLTDNPLVYPYIIVPLGLVLGPVLAGNHLDA